MELQSRGHIQSPMAQLGSRGDRHSAPQKASACCWYYISFSCNSQETIQKGVKTNQTKNPTLFAPFPSLLHDRSQSNKLGFPPPRTAAWPVGSLTEWTPGAKSLPVFQRHHDCLCPPGRGACPHGGTRRAQNLSGSGQDLVLRGPLRSRTGEGDLVPQQSQGTHRGFTRTGDELKSILLPPPNYYHLQGLGLAAGRGQKPSWWAQPWRWAGCGPPLGAGHGAALGAGEGEITSLGTDPPSWPVTVTSQRSGVPAHPRGALCSPATSPRSGLFWTFLFDFWLFHN